MRQIDWGANDFFILAPSFWRAVKFLVFSANVRSFIRTKSCSISYSLLYLNKSMQRYRKDIMIARVNDGTKAMTFLHEIRLSSAIQLTDYATCKKAVYYYKISRRKTKKLKLKTTLQWSGLWKDGCKNMRQLTGRYGWSSLSQIQWENMKGAKLCFLQSFFHFFTDVLAEQIRKYKEVFVQACEKVCSSVVLQI